MASSLASLAPELLNAIGESLSVVDLARLLRCNKLFRHRIEPLLYGSEGREEAMRWACKNGNTNTILLAVSYGADVSLVRVTQREILFGLNLLGQPICGTHPINPVVVSTLHLAARKKQDKVFRLLLNLGARIDHNCVDRMQLRKIMKFLCKPAYGDVLREFIDAGHGAVIKQHPEIDLPIVYSIRCGRSVDFIRILLELGANPNRPQRLEHIMGTPLSAAIERNSILIFDLLVESGAEIHGAHRFQHRESLCIPLRPTWRSHRHGPKPETNGPSKFYKRQSVCIPVFAAARMMPKYGLTMIQRCIDAGADINRRCFRHPLRKHDGYLTILLIYLDSIDSWSVDSVLSPVDGVKFLLQHNVILDVPDDRMRNTRTSQRTLIRNKSPLELLLAKWGLKQFSNPEFFAILRLLIENGAGKYHPHEILYSRKTHDYASLDEWKRFVGLFLKHRPIDEENPITNDDLLWHTIFSNKPCGSRGFSELARATATCLLEAGADINAAKRENAHIDIGPGGFDVENGYPVLHQVCMLRNLQTKKTFEHISAQENLESCPEAQDLFAFFIFLKAKGADPTIVVQGSTAIDWLLALQNHIRPKGKDCLLRIAHILQS